MLVQKHASCTAPLALSAAPAGLGVSGTGRVGFCIAVARLPAGAAAPQLRHNCRRAHQQHSQWREASVMRAVLWTRVTFPVNQGHIAQELPLMSTHKCRQGAASG